jgi:hypothetical protein
MLFPICTAASAAAAAGADVFFVDESLYADGDDLPEDDDDEEEVHEHVRYVPEDDVRHTVWILISVSSGL